MAAYVLILIPLLLFVKSYALGETRTHNPNGKQFLRLPCIPFHHKSKFVLGRWGFKTVAACKSVVPPFHPPFTFLSQYKERVAGVEPASLAWKARIIAVI